MNKSLRKMLPLDKSCQGQDNAREGAEDCQPTETMVPRQEKARCMGTDQRPAGLRGLWMVQGSELTTALVC